jgi:hypothetical protein
MDGVTSREHRGAWVPRKPQTLAVGDRLHSLDGLDDLAQRAVRLGGTVLAYGVARV